MKTLLACLTSDAHADDILSVAVPLARQHAAHLIGLHTIEALAIYPSVTVHLPDTVYSNFARSQNECSEAIRKRFESRVRTEGFVSEWRAVNTQSMTAADRMVEAAQTSDLIIMAQADATVDRADQHHAQEQVVRRSGRPVLHVPVGYRGDTVGKAVVIGWSPTREAARAVHDAIPLMRDGARAWIVAVKGGADTRFEGATELARALDRHGIDAEVVRRTARQQDIATMLEREALEKGADLIVTGAFGHSRLYDFVIGAVTLDLMRTAKLPVLFSR